MTLPFLVQYDQNTYATAKELAEKHKIPVYQVYNKIIQASLAPKALTATATMKIKLFSTEEFESVLQASSPPVLNGEEWIKIEVFESMFRSDFPDVGRYVYMLLPLFVKIFNLDVKRQKSSKYYRKADVEWMLSHFKFMAAQEYEDDDSSSDS